MNKDIIQKTGLIQSVSRSSSLVHVFGLLEYWFDDRTQSYLQYLKIAYLGDFLKIRFVEIMQ